MALLSEIYPITQTQGVQGVTGAGTQGASGNQGAQGLTGSGAQGVIGDQGVQGLFGNQGAQGLSVQGINGDQGVQGLIGDQGVQGLIGDQGVQGLSNQGVQGLQGLFGNQGLQGTSNQGLQGSLGNQGLQGTKGDDGTSVSIIGTTGLTPGNEQAELNSFAPGATNGNGVIDSNTGNLWVYNGISWSNVGAVRGPQGTQGIIGAGSQGTSGNQGSQGVQGLGAQGLIGDQGVQGLSNQGVQGLQGLQGLTNQGLQGLQGLDGGAAVTFTTSVTTARDFALTDAGQFVPVDSSSSVTLTIRLDATTNFPIGSQVNILRLGTGAVVISPEGGVTLISVETKRNLRAQNAVATIVKRAADSWVLFGDIS